MLTTRIRRTVTAASLVAASTLGALTLAAGPASAATVYYEWESEKSVLNLVMTAKDDVNGAAVGLGTDNDSSFALWSATHHGDNYWSYKLKATETFAQPLCLDVKGDSTAENAPIVVRPCDGSLSQRWTELGGSGQTNRLQNQWSHMYIHQPGGPEFGVQLKQNTLSGSGEPLSGLLWTWRSVVQ